MNRRTLRAFLIVALLLAAFVGHVMYWYQARPRPGAPSPWYL